MAVQAVRPVPSALPNADVAVERHGELGQRWLEGVWLVDHELVDAAEA